MAYINIRNKEFNQNSFNNFIDDLFKNNKIGVSKNNFCESYESICVVLFLVIFNQKINRNNQNEFAKKFNFRLNNIRSKELKKIINSNSIDIKRATTHNSTKQSKIEGLLARRNTPIIDCPLYILCDNMLPIYHCVSY